MAEYKNGASIPDRVVKIELISYFNRYPETVATSEDMACRLKRDPSQVKYQMEDLVELRILDKADDGNRTLYTYISPMSVSLRAKRGYNHAPEDLYSGVHGPSGTNGGRTAERDEEGEGAIEPESGVAMRMRLMIDTLKREGWRECLELLMDAVYSAVEAPCAAYHLGDGCSELYWDCQRGSNGIRAGMTKVRDVQNMVIEGELIRGKGFLETARHLKYLFPLGDDDDILICICRNGCKRMDLTLIRSLLVDIMPVVAEKYRLELEEEKSAERALQESIFARALGYADMREGLQEALASVAKSVEADRVSLLVEDGSGALRTLSTYGLKGQARIERNSFPLGEGIAGWCAANGDIAVLSEPRLDPRYIRNDNDDIDSMLCCPLIPPEGEAIGAICAVNKRGDGSGIGGSFDKRDVRLVEGIARTLTRAFMAKENGTRMIPRSMIDRAMAAHSF